jgi:hypothetical protein
MLLAPQIVPAVSGRFGGFGFGKIIHAGDPRAKRSHGAQTLIGFDLRRIAPAIYARQSAVRSLPQARGARSPRLGSEDTAGRRRLWKGPTSSLERHNPIPAYLLGQNSPSVEVVNVHSPLPRGGRRHPCCDCVNGVFSYSLYTRVHFFII